MRALRVLPGRWGRQVNPDLVRAHLGRPLDDFAEFLTATYAPLLGALTAAGCPARVERVASAVYTLTVTGPWGATVEITDGGRPLPATPDSVVRWLLRSGAQIVLLPGDTPLAEVAAGIAALAA